LPAHYFPLKPQSIKALRNFEPDYASRAIHILGGGGLGTNFFRPHLEKLADARRQYKLIAWGVGVDNDYKLNGMLDPNGSYELYGNYFDNFDEVGTRVYSEKTRARWVPCASCMHPAFFALRDQKPERVVGIYQHRDHKIDIQTGDEILSEDNSGNDILKKLSFMAKHEVIITNTYHGVYWATLLGRKVICLPFKSGLFSFKHRPEYATKHISTSMLQSAQSYGNSLEECRNRNITYYRYLTEKYGDI
jgi:hypothetical protein